MATTLTCLRCGSDLDEGDRYCAACGVESFRCRSCSQQLLPTDLTCPHCGTTAEHAVATGTEPPAEPSPDLDDIIARLRRATLGEYEIGRELGRGGMAAVFSAHDLALDRKVAIKVMSPGLVLGDGMTERFKQEAITVAQLHHPSIVSVHSVRQAEGLHFFVMQYVEGRSLEQVLQQARRLPLAMIRSILYQVGSALAYAHRARVVHRDVKPANILIDQDGNAVVTDFGIAKAAERPVNTLTGALVGTPAYMSPEQCAGGVVSGLSDQYSLGAVAYEMVTGEAPFTGSTLTVMQAHVERTPRPIAELSPDCPPEVADAIHRMLEKDPAARWPRMVDALTALGAEALPEEHQLRSELARHAIGAGSVTSDPTMPTSPVPRSRKSGRISAPYRSVGGISIMPAPAGFEVGDSFTLVAVLRGQHGTRLPPRAVEWSTDDPSVLRLDGRTALATALAPGTAIVTATCKSVSARLRVDVSPPRADDIVIEPLLEPLQAGEEVRLDATPRDKHGWPVYRPVTWSSADERIAEVTPGGTILGRAPGTVRLTAAVDDARASIVIPVLPPRVVTVDIADPPSSLSVGQTLRVGATPLDRANTTLPGRPIAWSSSDPSVVAVTDAGELTALRPGSAVLTASCEGVRAILRIGVAAPPAPDQSRPLVVPRRRSRRGRRRALLAGVVVLAGAVAWLILRPKPLDDRSGAPTAAPAGYTNGALGVDTSTAVAVVITQRPIRSLRPDSAATLAAEARDASGRVVPGARIAWSTSDSTIARVDRGTGRVQAIRPGRVMVAASSGTGRDSVVIAVRRPGARVPTVGSIEIATPPTLRTGDSVALRALVRSPRGDTLPGADVTWASSNPAVASVDALTGMAHAVEPGTTVVLARSGSESSFAELTVLGSPIAAIQILGARPMAVRETLALRITVNDGRETEPNDSPVSWASSDSSVAAVDPATGEVVGRAPGSVRISATADAATAWIRVTVLPRPTPLASAATDPTEGRLASGIQQCYGAVQAGDVTRLRAMWHPATAADGDRLRRLDHVLRDYRADVGERIDHAPIVGPESASVEFGVPLSWREPAGQRASTPVFRAEFVRAAGRWELSSCRILPSSGF
jgi:serine/threonine protein kinase/uncharacterized protein YjdB